ncbi:hypothetical protein [Streptomyces sp. TBY4]|uniref:hypothetical protein n=1 Tax=Streptomyces sp. TBY4 TaxID=2962030 RepID=UPI0020B70651|nr:hypothetical protein [Streptomyces sp. TBY4]MCP3753796.1 hypothetical protein [Streptomyces sp. TBY4]
MHADLDADALGLPEDLLEYVEAVPADQEEKAADGAKKPTNAAARTLDGCGEVAVHGR